MFEFIDKLAQLTPLYMLVFARLSAMVVTMPVFGFSTVYVRVRILFAFVLTLIITPMLSPSVHYMPTHLLQLFVDVSREILVGLMVGYGAQIIFEAIMIAGSFVGFQLGLAIMNVIDPTSQQNSPIIGNFWMMVILMFFIVTHAHYFLVETLFLNFKIIHPAAAQFHGSLGTTIIRSGSLMYNMAIHFAAPIMVLILIFDVGTAFMARVMPQMNIFFVSLPIKLLFGMFLLMISLNIFQDMFGYFIDQIHGLVGQVLQGI